MSEPESDEKETDEKDEKGRNESWDEKWRRDPVEAAIWACVLIWVGLVWLASNLDFWHSILGRGTEWWVVAFIGAGAIVLLGVGFRLLVPAYRRPVGGSLVLGLILIGVGLGQLTSWIIVGPLIVIAIGLGLLFTGLFRRGPQE